MPSRSIYCYFNLKMIIPTIANKILLLLLSVTLSLFSLIQVYAAASSSANETQITQEIKTTTPKIITVPYLTLRNRNTTGSSLEKFYGGNRGPAQAGSCEVAFSPNKKLQEIAEILPFYISSQKARLTEIRELPVERLLDEINTSTDNNLVLYFHGYNIGFWKSCRRSAMFQRSLELDDRFLLFSWPADGNVLKYTWDESDLHWSVTHIAEFLEKLIDRQGPGKVDIVAHSLGARGAILALAKMAYRQPGPPLINELALIAPDMDTEIFQQELSAIRQVVNRITIYVSENDKALKVSQEVHGYPRLGQAGKNLSIMEGVDTIDISLMSTQRLSGHLYHLFSPQVIEDLKKLLHTGKPPEQRSALLSQNQKGLPYWQMIPNPD